MSGWHVALAVALALAGGYVGSTWFARHFRGEPNDPAGAEPAIYLVIGGTVALATVVMLAVLWAGDLLRRLGID